MVRQPAVAGQFYPSDPEKLRREVESAVRSGSPKKKAIGIVSPHAGYIYSGKVAGEVYAAVDVPETVIVLGPNHHGVGERAALYPGGTWVTPLGVVPVEPRLSSLVLAHSSLVTEDALAHHYEHSLEVQLPFLQYLRPEVSIVPICLGFGDYESCRGLGEGLAAAVREFGRDVLIVASSDMTHYETAESAKKKDDLALTQALALNPEGLLSVCRERGITMCGVIPATVMLVAALGLGAWRGELVSYSTSGDVTGDNRQVVAYAGLAVW
jgi:MEMO1 family protein